MLILNQPKIKLSTFLCIHIIFFVYTCYDISVNVKMPKLMDKYI